jgi:hypothetical protein
MAMTSAEWIALAAVVSAMCDVIRTGRDAFEDFFENRRAAPDAEQRGASMAAAMSTYSDDEVYAIDGRIQNCRDRFIREGSGEQRKTCLCSVLHDVKDGNGGSISIDDWSNMYEQLGCAA